MRGSSRRTSRARSRRSDGRFGRSACGGRRTSPGPAPVPARAPGVPVTTGTDRVDLAAHPRPPRLQATLRSRRRPHHVGPHREDFDLGDGDRARQPHARYRRHDIAGRGSSTSGTATPRSCSAFPISTGSRAEARSHNASSAVSRTRACRRDLRAGGLPGPGALAQARFRAPFATDAPAWSGPGRPGRPARLRRRGLRRRAPGRHRNGTRRADDALPGNSRPPRAPLPQCADPRQPPRIARRRVGPAAHVDAWIDGTGRVRRVVVSIPLSKAPVGLGTARTAALMRVQADFYGFGLRVSVPSRRRPRFARTLRCISLPSRADTAGSRRRHRLRSPVVPADIAQVTRKRSPRGDRRGDRCRARLDRLWWPTVLRHQAPVDGAGRAQRNAGDDWKGGDADRPPPRRGRARPPTRRPPAWHST